MSDVQDAQDVQNGQERQDITGMHGRPADPYLSGDRMELPDLALTMNGHADRLASELKNFVKLTKATKSETDTLRREFHALASSPHVEGDILIMLRKERDFLARNLKNLDSMTEEFRADLQFFDEAFAGHDSQESDVSEMLSYRSRAQMVYDSASTRMNDAIALINVLDASIGLFEDMIPGNWKAYYLTESRLTSFDIPELTGENGYVSKWKELFYAKKQYLYPQIREDWTSCVTRFFMTAGIVALIGILLYRGSRYLPDKFDNWKNAVLRIVKGPWIYVNVGFALSNGFHNQDGRKFLFFFIPGILTLIWGLARISWKLRLAAKPDLAIQTSPLTRFFAPAVLGALFLFADIPTGALAILWFGVLLFFLSYLRTLTRRSRMHEELRGHLLERFAYGSAFYFALISLVMTVVGYPRIAILSFMVLFTLVNVLILGNSFAMLGTILCDSIYHSERNPVKYSVLNAFLVPASWSLSLVLTVPWIVAIPGLDSMFLTFLTAGLNIGEASVSLTKVFIILACFFLFRSLRKFGNTSLEHLPEELELNQMQRMSIRTILTYIVWTAFVLIALGLLGVNWTSLAAAAAGLGAAIGFGLQTLANNMASGIILIFGRSVKAGDFVEVGKISGTVRKVDFRCTEVITLGGTVVFIPNSAMVSNEFTNWSTEEQPNRLLRTLVIRVFYGTDISYALKLISDACEGVEGIETSPPPEAVLEDLNENYLEFNLFVTVSPVSKTVAILSELLIKIDRSLEEHGITLYRQSMDIDIMDRFKALATVSAPPPLRIHLASKKTGDAR